MEGIKLSKIRDSSGVGLSTNWSTRTSLWFPFLWASKAWTSTSSSDSWPERRAARAMKYGGSSPIAVPRPYENSPKMKNPCQKYCITNLLYKAKYLRWNSGKPHGQNAHPIEKPPTKFAPSDSSWERPCFNSGTLLCINNLLNRSRWKKVLMNTYPHKRLQPHFRHDIPEGHLKVGIFGLAVLGTDNPKNRKPYYKLNEKNH